MFKSKLLREVKSWHDFISFHSLSHSPVFVCLFVCKSICIFLHLSNMKCEFNVYNVFVSVCKSFFQSRNEKGCSCLPSVG